MSERYRPLFRVSWYNRDRRFDNGITWFRLAGGFLWGWGLWWKDTRIEGFEAARDAPYHRCWTLGPYVVAVLWPGSA